MTLLGIDYGTTSVKSVLFDKNLNEITRTTIDYTLKTKGDRVEIEAEKYFEMLKKVLSDIGEVSHIDALSIDTQCETLILTDENGNPVCDAIVWLDNRAVKEAEIIEEHFGRQKVYEITGQPEITATWPACKLLWVKNNQPEVWSKVKKIFLLEDYLLYKLTGEFVSEQTLQSSTIYFDIRNKCWWDEMLEFIGVDKSMLPVVCGTGEVIGEYKGIKIVTSAIDQIAGAIGAGVVKKGIVSEMTGTTMAIFAPTDTIPPYEPDSKIPCHMNFDGKYCQLMWTSTAGIALKWFKNNFCENFSFKELDDLAKDIPAGSDGLTFLPYLCGSTMPKYNPEAKGVFYGLTMEHTRGHMVRSILEAVSCMLKSNLDYANVECDEIRTMGGGAQSPLWCQIKADMIGKDFVTLKNEETACLGSAIIAGVGVGAFESYEKACDMAVAENKRYKPSGADYTECYKNYVEIDDKIF